jgi:hypothetical protein
MKSQGQLPARLIRLRLLFTDLGVHQDKPQSDLELSFAEILMVSVFSLLCWWTSLPDSECTKKQCLKTHCVWRSSRATCA